MTCQFCHKPYRASSQLINCCCRDQYRRYRRLYYESHRERIIEQQVRYQLKKLSRQRAVNGTYTRKAKPWTRSMVARWDTVMQGIDGWKRLRALMTVNHEKREVAV